MSNNYTPHHFEKNDILTAEALNDMDEQIDANSETLSEHDQRIANNESDLSAMSSVLENKQAKLVSGTNIKTINGESILAKGNINICNKISFNGISSPVSANNSGEIDITTGVTEIIEENISGIVEEKVPGIIKDYGFYKDKISLKDSEEQVTFYAQGGNIDTSDTYLNKTDNTVEDEYKATMQGADGITPDNLIYRFYASKPNTGNVTAYTKHLLKEIKCNTNNSNESAIFNNSIFTISNIQTAFLFNIISKSMGITSRISVNCFNDNTDEDTDGTENRGKKIWDLTFDSFNNAPFVNALGFEVEIYTTDSTTMPALTTTLGAHNMNSANSILLNNNPIFIANSDLKSQFTTEGAWNRAKLIKAVDINNLDKLYELKKLFDNKDIINDQLIGDKSEKVELNGIPYNTYRIDMNSYGVNTIGNVTIKLDIKQLTDENQPLHLSGKQISSIKVNLLVPKHMLLYNNTNDNHYSLPPNSPSYPEGSYKVICKYDYLISENISFSNSYSKIYKDAVIVKKGNTTFVTSSTNGGCTEIICNTPDTDADGNKLFNGLKIDSTGIYISNGDTHYRAIEDYITSISN